MKKRSRAWSWLCAAVLLLTGCVVQDKPPKEPEVPDGERYTLTLIDGNELLSANALVSGTPIVMPTDLHGVTGWNLPYPAVMPNRDLSLRTVREKAPSVLSLFAWDTSTGVVLYRSDAVALPVFESGEHEVWNGWQTENGDSISSPYLPAQENGIYTSTQKKEYTVTYRLGSREVGVQTYRVADAIVPLSTPAVAEGKIFGGWNELPDKMPAKNLTVISYEEIPKSLDLSTLASGETFTITESGVWTLTGTASNAAVAVNVPDGHVTIKLNGVDLTCGFAASPIFCEKASTFTVQVADGTHNKIADCTLNPNDASITVKNATNCTFGGKGSLSITSSKSAVYHSKNLAFYNGTYVFNGESGAEGKQSLTVAGGSFTVTAKKWAFKTGDDKGLNTAEGEARFTGGTVNATTETKGINVYGSLTVSDSSLTIRANGTGDAVNVSGAATVARSVLDLTAPDHDGLQADASLCVTDSSLSVKAGQDCLKSDGSVTVARSNLSLEGSEDGIDGADKVSITASQLDIAVGEDGIKGKSVTADYVTATGKADGDGLKTNGTTGTLSLSHALIALTCGGDGLSSLADIRVSGSDLTITAGTKGETAADGTPRSRVGIKAGGALVVDSSVLVVSTPDICLQSATYTSEESFYTLNGTQSSVQNPTGEGNAYLCTFRLT